MLAGILLGYHSLLIEKIKDVSLRFWYMKQTATNGWNLDTFAATIKTDLYNRQSLLARDNRKAGSQ